MYLGLIFAGDHAMGWGASADRMGSTEDQRAATNTKLSYHALWYSSSS
jgi:hypothetical protein